MPRWGAMALLLGAAAGGACGGPASGDDDDGTGAKGGAAMAGASGRGGSAAGGQGAGGSESVGGNAGAAGASMGGGSSTSPGSCSAPTILGGDTSRYVSRIESYSENAFDPCRGRGPEEVIRWTPPTSSRYLIDTYGAPFEAVLYVSSNLECPPTAPNWQLECSGSGIGIAVEAVGGRDILIVVDSFSDNAGDFTLNIRGEAECPTLDLGEQLGAAVYSAFEFADDAGLLTFADAFGCRGGDLGVTLAWQAPLTGVYQFDTSGSSFGTALALREGGCRGQFLGCDYEEDINKGSEVTLSLDQGEEVVIEVTSVVPLPLPSFGQFVLNIEPL